MAVYAFLTTIYVPDYDMRDQLRRWLI